MVGSSSQQKRYVRAQFTFARRRPHQTDANKRNPPVILSSAVDIVNRSCHDRSLFCITIPGLPPWIRALRLVNELVACECLVGLHRETTNHYCHR